MFGEAYSTITLGFDGDVWPIFMGDKGKENASEVKMSVGDAVLYRGMEKHHWRDVYTEGKWQAQVFLYQAQQATSPWLIQAYCRLVGVLQA